MDNEPTTGQEAGTAQGQPVNNDTNAQGTLIDQAVQLPESYDFTGSIPEGYVVNDDMTKAFGDICRDAHLSNEQANAIAKYGFDWMEKTQGMADEARAQAAEQEQAATVKALGADLEPTMRNLNQSMNYFERKYPGFVEAVNASGLGNNLAFCRTMSDVAKMIGEDKGVAQETKATAESMYPNTDFSKYGGK